MSWSDYVLLDDVMRNVGPEAKKDLTNATRVNVDDIAMSIFTFKKEVSDVTQAPLKAPFPLMWLEYKTLLAIEDDTLNREDHGDEVIDAHVDQVGVLLRWDKSIKSYGRIYREGRKEFPSLTELIVAEVWVRVGSKVMKWSGLTIVALDDKGYFLTSYYGPDDDGSMDDSQAASMVHLVKVALAGVAMMNCKNVGLTEHRREVKQSKKSRRPKPPKLTFHTIKLPGVTYSSDGTTSMSKGDMAHHLVRGHFKTYTADKPLLGKVTGTYWWAPQARGKKSNGIVVKDYEVSDPR